MTVRIGVLGAGYWGPNLIRNFAEAPGASLVAVCDKDADRRRTVSERYASVATYADYDAMLKEAELDAVVVATPVSLHFDHAKRALAAGKHVLVEKPLAMNSQQCRDLMRLALARGRVLMVGHTFLYNEAVRHVKRMIQAGELGDLLYLYSQRLNLGIVRQDINAMWNLAPHDLSILNHFVGENPSRVTARGFTYLQHGLPDVVFLTIDYPGGVSAHVHVSWLDPQKIRKMAVVGRKKMVIYDDLSLDAKVQVFDKGVDRFGVPVSPAPPFGEYQLQVRSGDLAVPQIDFVEPLKTECAHFIECVRGGRTPDTDGLAGLRVVSILEAADRSIAAGGQPQDVPSTLFEPVLKA